MFSTLEARRVIVPPVFSQLEQSTDAYILMRWTSCKGVRSWYEPLIPTFMYTFQAAIPKTGNCPNDLFYLFFWEDLCAVG